ncbi:hypothetical protein AK830_g6322 [Neonectria ditissima]|uniref:Uncharacterized protein n=1 Tax=Neonectria ditissima TaxID=78410 RepID=A0A0P7B0T0_9HYPO|nr:hypothetical protein AK830_g6322 [Neonectria ditissima]
MKLPYTLIAACLASTATALPATTTRGTPAVATHNTPSATGTSAGSSAHLRPRQSSPEDDPPPYVPIVTAAPTQDAALASLGYYQTTYYECHTRGGEEHCGWHIPVVKDNAACGGGAAGGAWSAGVAVGVAVAWVVM